MKLVVISDLNLIVSLDKKMYDLIQIDSAFEENPDRCSSIRIGTHAKKLIEYLKTDYSKETIVNVFNEASHILCHCIKAGDKSSITNIAYGYIQSGKTMSYLALSALAADNKYRVIIYLTGTTLILNNQTFNRICKDLQVDRDFTYKVYEDSGKFDSYVAQNVAETLNYDEDTVMLFPVLKHPAHIQPLCKIFNNDHIKQKLREVGVLIIDDEADQASLNTYARTNAKKGTDILSATYEEIFKLRTLFPSLSYIQYTATPQAAFLIDENDILSPKFHTVLTPGKGYCGGKYFFKEHQNDNVCIIPQEEVYDKKRNNFKKIPPTLTSALRQFLLSVSVVVFIEKRTTYLSMMVHPDGYKDSNEKFYKWIRASLKKFSEKFHLDKNDVARMEQESKFKQEYEKLSITYKGSVSFDDAIEKVPDVIRQCKLHLVQDGSNIDAVAEHEIKWKGCPAHILVGANILNRGFTVEHLSMTYMPRTSKGIATADTIEQRCRFFGYKEKYIDVCRIFISKKSLEEFQDYVDHEETLMAVLKECNSLNEFSDRVRTMILSHRLKPTRNNILSSDLIRGSLSGWKTLGSTDNIEENKKLVSIFIDKYNDKFKTMNPEMTDATRRHRSVSLDIDDFISFFKKLAFSDFPNYTQKIVTLQYLLELKEKGYNIAHVIQMSYDLEPNNLRKREFRDKRPVNLMMGYNPAKTLPADSDFKYEDGLTLQLHHVQIKSDGFDNGKDLYNFTIYYPEKISNSFIAVDNDGDYKEDA